MPMAGYVAIAIALACAGLMGFAIQSGATCAVAAVDEIVRTRRARRLAALAEATVWVAGLLVAADLFGLLAMRPAEFAVTGWTVAGGVLLGIGALVNGACVFGSIARIGSRDWAYLMTPIGFFFGCLTVAPLFAAMMPMPIETRSGLFENAHWLLWPFLAFAGWRLWQTAAAARAGEIADHIWAPHRATALIGITFAVMLLLVGTWSYTQALADLANGMTLGLPLRLTLLAALFLGALAGGWAHGLTGNKPRIGALAQCFAGGMLMGWGGALVPGSNDGLILIGIPFFQPHAWLALTVMCLSIAIGIALRQRLQRAIA